LIHHSYNYFVNILINAKKNIAEDINNIAEETKPLKINTCPFPATKNRHDR